MSMIATCKRLAAVAACIALAAFASGAAADPAAVKVAESPPAIQVGGRSPLKLAIFRKSRVALPMNERIGDLQEGDLCSAKGSIPVTQKLAELVTRQALLAYRAEMSAAGYPAAADTSLFEEKPAAAASDFDVGATIRGMQLSLCRKGIGYWGGVWFQVKWEVYSPAARKVMYETVTEGSYQNAAPEKITVDEMFARALAKSARNMLADEKFVDLLTGAVEIPAAAAPASAAPAPGAALAFKRGRAPAGGAAKNAAVLRGAVVTILVDSRTGSGFFVSREGHVLTNAHVVGEARIVKVRLATGRELVGEVLKTDRLRDVALIKTEIAGVPPLAIRDSEPNVGEDVYALGAP